MVVGSTSEMRISQKLYTAYYSLFVELELSLALVLVLVRPHPGYTGPGSPDKQLQFDYRGSSSAPLRGI